ncbi:hypothetical protein IQ06DRAFT_350192 [Phaeosphaeriaceae sp. SRC1lsM3a]|nr:hypothetical protein IQ06DRAFT_350192 [Stagonospora sp. SRC1lsM3a]
MPRNGDGSSDNGPIEGHEILHGTSGDKTLQHTKHVAPMPKHEDGEALPGMNASGGAAAPLNDASEEYGASAPRNERFEGGQTSTSTGGGASNSQSSRTGTSSSSATTKSQQQSSTNTKSSHEAQYGSEKHDLDSVSREKAERFVNLNEEDVQHAGSTNKSSSGAQRSSQRAPKEVGSKEDIEQLHGKASSSGNNKGNERSSGQSHQHDSHKSGGSESHAKKSGNGGEHEGDLESMRHTAEKFVNLEE